jgi:nucleotide-binding universal stress UspA family protein
MMWDRILLALDEHESGQAAVRFTRDLATVTQSDVRVLHIRTLSKWARVLPLETPIQAEDLVHEAVFTLRLAGLGAEGRKYSVIEDQVALRIVEESLYWLCDAIVLGTRRLRGIGRLSGRGVREQVVRLSLLPVLAAPAPSENAVHHPLGFGTNQPGRTKPRHKHGGESP